MIGFDIGGTKCAVCIGKNTENGLEIVSKKVIPTDHSVSPYEMLDRMCALAESMTDDFSKIGISCGGPLDSVRGLILSPPNLPGWDNVEVISYLKKRYGGEVALQNDANACALAEWKFGAGRGTKNMVFLTFGSGLGAGMVLNGALYCGACDMAGEVGHIRISEHGPVGYGKSGSFEGFCSGNGLAELGRTCAKEALQMGKTVSYCSSTNDLDGITAKTIADCADAGNSDAKEVYALCARKLGMGLSIIIDILNPEMIVLGSIFRRSENLLRDEMEKVLEKECLAYSKNACRVVPAELGESIGDYAALSVADTLGE